MPRPEPTPRPRISIHAPPRGATSRDIIMKNTGKAFQFTPLREGRQGGSAGVIAGVIISIHAPPRGATCGAAKIEIHAHISIHAPPRGATSRWPPAQSSPSYFNSRPSARGDGKRYAISANLLFNPYKSAWLNNSATQFVEIILVIFHRIIA